MVLVAKSVALNMDSAPAVAEWRTQNSALLDAAEGENLMLINQFHGSEEYSA